MSAETFYEEPQVIDSLVSWHEDRATGELTMASEQYIPDDWLSEISKEKIDSVHTPTGDFYRVASVPVEVINDLWTTYGFDFMNAPTRECLAMLNRYALDKFITTNKQI